MYCSLWISHLANGYNKHLRKFNHEGSMLMIQTWMKASMLQLLSWLICHPPVGNNHHVNEVHPNAIQINDSVNYQLSHEMHHEEQSDSDVESELDDNTTPYHQLELERRAKVVPTEVSTGSSANISMVTILDEMRDTLDEKLKKNLEYQYLK
ncbi:hypothetical protein Tco_0276335 [Tanacetum coccineum]